MVFGAPSRLPLLSFEGLTQSCHNCSNGGNVARVLDWPSRPRTIPGVKELKAATMTEPEEQGDNRRGAIAGLVIAVVLLAIGVWLAHDLRAASKLQDCVMSGRTNCNVIEPAQ